MKSPMRWFVPVLLGTALLAGAVGWWLRDRVEHADQPSENPPVLAGQGGGRQERTRKETSTERPQPVIAIVAEAPGMAPEEVELAVALPIETQVNGMPGVRLVQSACRAGTCTVWVHFEPTTDMIEAQQRLLERVHQANLPPDAMPMLAPVTFRQSEVLLIGLRSAAKQGMDLRTLAEHVVRERLLRIPGVSQVFVTGGVRKRCEVELDPKRLSQFGVTLTQVEEALERSNALGAFGNRDKPEGLVLLQARFRSLEDIKATVVLMREGAPVRIGDIATVRFGGPDTQGDAAIRTEDGTGNGNAVILSVLREPNTPDGEMARLLTELQKDLPADVELEHQPFTREDVCVSLQLPPGTNRQAREQACRQMEAALMDIPEIKAIWRRIGLGEAADYLGWGDDPVLFLSLQRKAERDRESILADIRERIVQVPAVSAQLGPPASHRLGGAGLGAQIAVKIFGPDLEMLWQTAQVIRTELGKVPAVVDLQVAPQPDREQLHLEIRREQAAELGVSVADLAMILEAATEGRVVGGVLDQGHRLDLVIAYGEKLRDDPEALGKLSVITPAGMGVPLGLLAEFRRATGPTTIHREKMQRRIVISCNVQDREPKAVLADIREKLKAVEERLNEMPGGYRIEYAGDAMGPGS